MIKRHSLEERIIKILQGRYPITVEDIERELRVHGSRVERALRTLESGGYIELERLPDKVFVRLRVVFGPLRFDENPDHSPMYG